MIQDNKVCESIRWNTEKSKFMVFRITKTYNIDEIRQTRLSKNPIAKTETWHELDVCKPKLQKKISVPVVLYRCALDPSTMKTIEGYFVQTLEIEVLSDSVYQYKYLSKCEGKIFIHDLDLDFTVPLVLSGGDVSVGVQAGINKKFVGSEKRISVVEKDQLKQQGCLICEQNGEEFKLLI
jgi:hypothetical protein